MEFSGKFSLSPIGQIPNERQFRHYHYKKAFFHFGVNTFTDAEWGNGSERETLFNPTALDIGQWMRTIKAAHFDLAIITAKHHDGFCLWPSAYTEHSVKNSPYKDGKGDIIREFVDAAREYHIKVGIYLSPWDRHSPYWGTPEYSVHYAKQLKELMTGYGKIDEVWWDGAGSSETVYDWGRWASIVREYQPDAAIFGSMGASAYVDLRWVGNEQGHAGETHYAAIDEKYLTKETPKMLNVGNQDGERFIPSESDVSIRPGWFYHEEQDNEVKTPAALNKIWFESVGRNSIFLLSFPPDRRGLICDKDARSALLSDRAIRQMLAVNYALDAEITADSVLDGCLPIHAALPDEDLYYAAEIGRKTCRIDLVWKTPTMFNVLILGEEIRLGERINAFVIEDVAEDGTPTEIFRGSSVGFTRACRLPEKTYTHIRVRVTGAVGEPVLSRLGAYLFADVLDAPCPDKKENNLAALPNAKVFFSADKTELTVQFGGIYPFSEVSFTAAGCSTYRVFAFNGTSWELIAEGKTSFPGERVKSVLSSAVTGSYQVKIISEGGLEENTLPLIQ